MHRQNRIRNSGIGVCHLTLKQESLCMEFDGEDYSDVTRDYLLKKMKEDPSVVAITSGNTYRYGIYRG